MTETATVPVKSDNAELRRPHPFDTFGAIADEFIRMWGPNWPFGAWLPARHPAQFAPGTTAWPPRVDVFEKDGNLIVKAELPGLKKEDIEVTLDEGDLMIRGERKAESEVKEDAYYRMERSYGSFYRRLALPFEADAAKIKASYEGGILELRIPKPAAEERPEAKSIMIV
jgi:HSP20 family protein